MNDEPLYVTGVIVGRCGSPTCRSIHLDFIGEHDDVIACAAVPISELPEFIECLQTQAREISERKMQ